MEDHHGLIEEKRLLYHRLLYGYYPEVLNNPGSEREVLKQLSDSYLYKDVLLWERMKKPEKLVKLLQALSFQLGSEVTYNNIGSLILIDNQTVENYFQLMEQAYIIFRLPTFGGHRTSRKLTSLKTGMASYMPCI